jgi:hypothetical protein
MLRTSAAISRKISIKQDKLLTYLTGKTTKVCPIKEDVNSEGVQRPPPEIIVHLSKIIYEDVIKSSEVTLKNLLRDFYTAVSRPHRDVSYKPLYDEAWRGRDCIRVVLRSKLASFKKDYTTNSGFLPLTTNQGKDVAVANLVIKNHIEDIEKVLRVHKKSVPSGLTHSLESAKQVIEKISPAFLLAAQPFRDKPQLLRIKSKSSVLLEPLSEILGAAKYEQFLAAEFLRLHGPPHITERVCVIASFWSMGDTVPFVCVGEPHLQPALPLSPVENPALVRRALLAKLVSDACALDDLAEAKRRRAAIPVVGPDGMPVDLYPVPLAESIRARQNAYLQLLLDAPVEERPPQVHSAPKPLTALERKREKNREAKLAKTSYF